MSTVLDILSWILLVSGGVVSIVAGIGLVRFPGLYSRMHAASMIDTLGAGCVLLGLILQAGVGVIGFKLLLVFVLLTFTTTTAGHALAKSALATGLLPVDKDGEQIPVAGSRPEHGKPDGPEVSSSKA